MQRPGIASTIIGARTMEQLDDNLGALEVKLTAEQIKALDEVSQPKLNFPHDFLGPVKAFGYNGATIDGQAAPVNPLSPASDAETVLRYGNTKDRKPGSGRGRHRAGLHGYEPCLWRGR